MRLTNSSIMNDCTCLLFIEHSIGMQLIAKGRMRKSIGNTNKGMYSPARTHMSKALRFCVNRELMFVILIIVIGYCVRSTIIQSRSCVNIQTDNLQSTQLTGLRSGQNFPRVEPEKFFDFQTHITEKIFAMLELDESA